MSKADRFEAWAVAHPVTLAMVVFVVVWGGVKLNGGPGWAAYGFGFTAYLLSLLLQKLDKFRG